MTLFLFLGLVAVCSYWALQILAPRPAIAPSASIGDNAAAPNLAPAAALFGSPNAVTAGAPSAPSNIQVSGVVEAGSEGVVILSVDGKPGMAYAVGALVTEGTSVTSVALGKVVLNQRGRLIELKTPERASLNILSSGVGKARPGADGSAISPVPTRLPAATAPLPPPLPPAALPATPQFQAPQPPQQQQMQPAPAQQQFQQQQIQQQQQQIQQQLIQQQQLQQQLQQQGQAQSPMEGTMQGQQPALAQPSIDVQQSSDGQQPGAEQQPVPVQ